MYGGDEDECVVIVYNWDELCWMMWDYVSIMCMMKWLECVCMWIMMFVWEIYDYYWNFFVDLWLLELCNLIEVVGLVVMCVL